MFPLPAPRTLLQVTLALSFAACLPPHLLAAGPPTNNLVLWLDASNGLAPNGSAWTDLSGQGHNATALTGQAPAVVAGAINGLPAAQFSGGQALSISGQVLTDPLNYSIIAVVTDATAANHGFREIFSNWAGSNGFNSVFLGNTGFNPDRVRFTDRIGGASDPGAAQVGRGALVDATSPFILSGLASSANAAIYQNSNLLYSLGATIPSSSLTTGYFIGRQGSANSEYWSGYIAEILVYNSTLTVADFNADIAYLANKWLPVPAAVSAGPASGSNFNQPMTFTFSDASGWQTLGVVNALINDSLDGRHACYVAYSAPGKTLFLVDDTGDAGGPYAGTMVLNGNGAIANSQCAIFGAGSSAVGSGNTLTLTLNMSFQPAFAGNKVQYLAARDNATGNSNWQPLGTWQVPGAAQTTTTSIAGMSPASGAGHSQIFTFTFNDSKGYQDLGVVNVLLNNALDGRQACYLAYSRPANALYLVDDTGDGTRPFAGALALNGSGSINNSQCTIVGFGSSAVGTGNTLTLTLNMAFNSGFAGNRVFYLAARDLNDLNNTGWQSLGSWAPQ